MLENQRYFRQRILKRTIRGLARLSKLQFMVFFVAMAVLISVLIVLTIDFLWDGRFNPELEFAGVMTPFLDAILLSFLFTAILDELREEIEGRSLAAAAIEASEKKIKALFHAVNDAIMIIDPAGRILDVNNVTSERLGYSRDELLKMTPRDFATPEYAAKVAERLTELKRSGSAIFETAWASRDGRIVPIEISARAIEYDGKPAFLGVARDLTERKKMEDELKESNIFTGQVISSAGEGIIVYGHDLRYQVWNPYMERLTGLPADKVVGQHPLTLFPFLQETRVLECLQQALHGDMPDAIEFQYTIPNTGRSGWALHTEAPLQNTKGEIIGVIATVSDITERKQAEEALRKSEEFNRSILESIDEGFIVIDRDYRIVSANRAFIGQTGIALEDMTGKHCFEISHHCEAPCYEEGEMCAVKQVFDTGESRAVVHAHYDVKGTPIYVETKAYPLTKDKSGRVITVIEIIVDITEKKKAEERLKLLNECFLEFGTDPIENINRLVSLCGKFMGGTCALYNRLENKRLCSWGQWNVPKDYNPVDAPEGHICYDVIKGGSDEVVVLRNLPETMYARTDPNVTRYNLQTYIGKAVKFSGAYVGSLCVVYQKDILPSEDDKRILGIIASAIGIEEERKKAEEAVRAAVREWSESFDAMADGVSILSSDYTIMNVNQSLCKLLGKTSEELIGKKCYQVFHGKACPLADSKGRTQKDYIEIYEPAINKWLAVSTSPMLDEAGSMIKVVHTVRDVTERRQAEEELTKLTHKISLILNSAGEGIYGVDLEGNVTFINPAGARMLGYEVEELLGRQSHATWHHHKPDGTALPVEECVLNGVLKEGTLGAAEDVVFWKKDGTKFPVEYASTPIFEAGMLGGAVVTFKDITSQLLEEQEKNKLEAQLRHAQKMEAVGTLAGGVAHDFNNILNVIIGYGVMLLDRLGDDQLSKEQLNEVLSAADRAANLTKRLLSFSRKQVVEMKPLNVNELIRGIEKMLTRIISEDITLTMELTSGKMIVMADTGQMEQVLMNLVTNARHAMPKGGKLTISTGIKEMDEEHIASYGYGKAGTYALISVADTGSGMDPETQKKIFEPFFTTKGIGEGTGLGLAISYGIIKQHNGYIKVYSKKDKGTTFSILLPVAEEKAKGPEGETAAQIKGGTETILVAEDDDALRKLTRIILESFGYTVITAEDGEEAITKYIENKGRIQLVILDMLMPKKNGKEAYKEIKKIRPDVRALFISGYTADVINKKDLLDSGMDFILKPVSTKDLTKKVRETLDR